MIITDFKLRQYAQEIGRILVNLPIEGIVELRYEFYNGNIPEEFKNIYPFNECENGKCSHLNALFYKIFDEIIYRIVPCELLFKYRVKMDSEFDFMAGLEFDIEEEKIKY